MINIKLSQYHLFHLVSLTDEQIKEIEAAREAATQFIKAGTKQYPIVDFYVENDCIAEAATERVLGSHYDGKGFEVRYGLLPKNSDDRFPIIHLTAVALNEDLADEPVIPELELITKKKFNTYGHDVIKLEPMDYKHPYVKATHMIKFHDTASIAANFPIDIWEEALPLHYLFNELNSNRKWKDPESEDGNICDVMRLWDDKYHKVDYYADVYEHTPDGAAMFRQRNFLFKKVKEKDIIYKD